MVEPLRPAIERRLEKSDSRLGTRKRAAEQICNFLDTSSQATYDMPLRREQFYSACQELLRERDSERILLYLPLEYLEDAPMAFRETYRDAWYRLLNVRDVRENFHMGDCFELDARPSGGLERVVKCAHLTPWLFKFGYLEPHQVLRILDGHHDDETLLQSFKDTWKYIAENRILSATELNNLISKTTHLPKRKKPEPLYISKKRVEWLNERNQSAELLTPSAKLEGPFSDNIPMIRVQLEEIASRLKPSEIVLVGGSQLKGYGTTNSDLDVWNLEQLLTSKNLRPGSPHAAHIFLNTIWLSGKSAQRELETIADRVADVYSRAQPIIRRQSIERLESDLLQYRLLHKGFSRVTSVTGSDLPPEMDGDCPFYCSKYRRIATMLYAKYVWF